MVPQPRHVDARAPWDRVEAVGGRDDRVLIDEGAAAHNLRITAVTGC